MTKTSRVESLDVLKGLVIIIMALDHTRDYFHYDSFFIDPTDPDKTSPMLFFTRWITHYCAPAFSFLAGTSAFLVGRRKSKAELSNFLLKRGLWLILIEFTVVKFGWRFALDFNSLGLLVIWSLGISMILLAGLIHLPMRGILIFSLIVIFGHNLLDGIHIENNFLWNVLHKRGVYEFGDFKVRVIYPLLPWVGVMSLGYYFGKFYDKSVDAVFRQKLFTRLGLGAILLFVIVRYVNAYGNPQDWWTYVSTLKTFYSFMDPLKYPPSLSYLLMTLGPALIFLGLSENWKGRAVDFCKAFGKVPFFAYILHIYLIHVFAMILAELTGFGWRAMVLDGFVSFQPQLAGFGVGLGWTYLIWASIILMLYPFVLRFGRYKLAHKEKWWLSYL